MLKGGKSAYNGVTEFWAEVFMKKLKLRNIAIFLCAVIVFAVGAYRYLPGTISVTNSAGGRELPIYSVDTDKKQAALTFDAAWGNEDTRILLSILKKHDVRATFFMTGQWAAKYPEDVKMIKDSGHDLGNHSENHKNMGQLDEAQCKDEIMTVHEKVKKLTGVEMKLFRPPYGDYNDQVIRTVTDCGYFPIQWDVDSLDWKDYGADNIVQTVLDNKDLKNGSIILMHNGAKYTKDALDAVITGLKEKGYELVPVSELIYREDYHLDNSGRQVKN